MKSVGGCQAPPKKTKHHKNIMKIERERKFRFESHGKAEETSKAIENICNIVHKS